MPLFHIHGLIGATLSSLAAGASVVCTPGFYATQFFGWLDEFRPTWYTAVPTMHQAILARAAQNQEAIARSKLRLIRSCSAALPPRVMAELERVFGVPVIESYGMTEAAHQMASNPLLPGQRKPGSVGVAAGPQIAIMADGGELLPPEMVGEIVISGANVTRGYENNPAANEAAFTKGWFRTGDQGRMDADGYLFITGRTKEIINRGGEKISPREIDEALLDHPAVAQAIAFAIPDEKLGEDVGAAVVLRADAAVSATELREFVARRLTDFKVPRRVVFLDEIPKGPTGKPQRIGLAEKLGITKSTPQKAMEAGPSSAPSTRTETLLVDTWREVLRLETVNTRDDFFLLGGDSILAAQFISRLRDASGAELSMVNLFEMPTIAQLAAWLDSTSQSQTQSKLPPIRRARGATAPLVTAAGSRSPANMHDTRAPAGETAGLPGEFPLSFSQERMWFLAEYEETHAAYIRTAAFRLRGLLNVEAIEKSLASIVERHEALRTTYHARDGLPMQVISAPFPVPLLREDLSRLDEPERMPRFMQLAIEEAHRPFDLSRDLMLRSMLLKLDREDHILLLAMHHIATDGWSQGILLSELNEIYNAYCEGLPPKLPELPVQYADFAIWQREVFESRTLAEDLTYWKKRLAGAPPVLRLPADHPRPKLLSYRGARQSLTLPKPLTESLKELSKQEKVTLFMTLVAAFNALLFRYTGQEDILIGTPVASRNQVETERLIGFFANTLVLRTDLTGDPTFRELLERVRNTALEVYAHQDLPFEKLVMMLEPERSLSYSPVFQVMFNLRNLHAEALSLRGLEIEEIDLDPRASQFDLTLMVTELAEGLSCAAIYNTDLFEAETIRRLLRHFETILGGAVKDPAARLTALPILAEPERRQLLVDWNNTRRAYPQLCVHELFEMHAEQNPGATALVFDGGRFSYRELNQRANRLAHRLRALGVGAEATVGICFERSPEAIIGLLGVLKAGEAYMPLDPAYPEERLSFMVKDAGARVVLTMRRWLDKLATKGTTVVCLDDPPDTDAQQETCNIAAGVGPDNLAYILYTSGSTGAPKGVEIPHRGIVRLVVGVDYMRFTNREVFLQLASLSFDASTFEIWGALLHGATLVLFPGRVPTAHDLGEALMRHKVTTACLTTPVFHAVVDEAPEALSTVRQLLIGGEALSAAHVRRALAALPATQIVNGYGPTESTTAACCYAVPRRFEEDASSVPIGRPISNTQVYILDKQSEPVPMGVTGELHIGGDGLARGYVNRPDLTREKFIPIPRALQNDVPPGRLYKTGDLARYLPDGNIEFLGRVDDQLKIRGYRIEPGEIEAALNQHPAVKNAAVMARPIQGGEGSLVGYVVPKDGQALTAQGLQTFLKQKLPQYMIPAQFMFMTSLPLTPVGKVDRRALPAPEAAELTSSATFIAPRDEAESKLLAIWQAVLGNQPISVADNFFELGGHSLLAARLLVRVEKAFGQKLSLAALFQAPTIEQLARMLRDEVRRTRLPEVTPIQPGGSRPPFFCIGAGPLFRSLALRLGTEQPFLGVELGEEEARALTTPFKLEDMASLAIKKIRMHQSKGPYLVGGWCMHGVVAYEIAQQLQAQGEKVALVVLFDSENPASLKEYSGVELLKVRSYLLAQRWRFFFSNLHQLRPQEAAVYVRQCVASSLTLLSNKIWEADYKLHLRVGRRIEGKLLATGKIFYDVVRHYRPRPYSGKVVLVRCETRPKGRFRKDDFGWSGLAVGGLELYFIPGNHADIFREPNVEVVASKLNVCFDAALGASAADQAPQGFAA